jgi:hypothetical protein
MIRKKHLLTAAFTTCLLAPFTASAGDFDAAVKQAEAEIDRAKSMNYEWRDSRKMLKEARELHEKGDKDKALQLAKAAGQQGKMAVAQAESQSAVNGPHN